MRPDGIAEIIGKRARDGVAVFTLSTHGGTGRDAFFATVRENLPLDPPVVSARSWEALADSLWEGIHSMDADHVVIAWPDAYEFNRADPESYEMAINVLREVVDLLVDPVATVGAPKHLAVYIGDPAE